MALGFAPISSGPISSQPIGASTLSILATATLSIVAGATETIYAGTVPFITLPTDNPSNRPFEGTLESTLRVDRSIVSTNAYGGFSENFSELSLINTDGFYDQISDLFSVNGQHIHFSVGTVTGRDIVSAYSAFEHLIHLTGERMRIERDRLVIEARDPALHLSTETVQQQVYAGTGGLEGSSEIAGKRRPFGDGVVFNATPTLVIANELLWQFNAGAVTSVDAVKDGGVELTFFADYPNVAALRLAGASGSPDVIPSGSYATCIAEGYFVTGGASFKQITVDFTGLRLTTADIIENVALTSAALAAVDLDSSSFNDVNIAQPAQVGYYLGSDSNETCSEMFTKLMTGIGGWFGMTPLGTLQIRRFDRPTNIASTFYDDTNILDLDRAALPQGIDPPPHRWRVIYGRNWTIMTDLFGAVSQNDPAMADYLMKPYKLVSTTVTQTNAVLANWPDAPDGEPVESYFAVEADAQTEAQRLFDLYTIGLNSYRLTLKNAMFLHEIGEIINVTNSRFGLANGRYLRIVELTEDLASMSTDVIGFG